jgi:hypothetical protein
MVFWGSLDPVWVPSVRFSVGVVRKGGTTRKWMFRSRRLVWNLKLWFSVWIVEGFNFLVDGVPKFFPTEELLVSMEKPGGLTNCRWCFRFFRLVLTIRVGEVDNHDGWLRWYLKWYRLCRLIHSVTL